MLNDVQLNNVQLLIR